MIGRKLRNVLLAVLLLALAIPVAVRAEQPACVSIIPFNTPVGCIYAHLEPGTLTGDLDIISHTTSNGFTATGTFTITSINYSALNYSTDQTGTAFQYRFYNIQEGGNPDFGTWYTYKELTKTITVPGAGQVRDVAFKPAKSYIRGKLEVTCDLKNFKGEDANCSVLVDGADKGPLAAGGKITFVLDPGSHTLEVDLAGSQANLWAPNKFVKTLTVKPSATITKVSASFAKAGHLIVSLDQPGVVGDFYLNGTLAGAQVASLDQWVTPNQPQKVEVKNLTDPAANGQYRWKDAQGSFTVPSGAVKTATIKLQKEFLIGFLAIKCDIRGDPLTSVGFSDPVNCYPNIDGTDQPIILRGQTATYPLTLGSHDVWVTNNFWLTVTPGNVSYQYHKVTIAAGKTVTVVYLFTFK